MKVAKKVLLLSICVSLICFGLVVQAAPASGEDLLVENDIEYSVIDADSVEVCGYIGSESKIEIPSETEGGYRVISIGSHSFFENKIVKEIILPNTIERIGSDAFRCSTLESINLPDSVKEVEASAFSDTPLFEKSKVNGVAYVDRVCVGMYEDGLLETVTEKKEVSILPDTRFIANDAFGRNSFIKKVTVPDGIQYVGVRAFRECINLETVDISPNVKVLDDAFISCQRLKSVKGDIAYLERSKAFRNTPFKTRLFIKRHLIGGGITVCILLLIYTIYRRRKNRIHGLEKVSYS